MVGRNDPCPCGSGKKYKKCCAEKNELSVETLVDEELERIVSGVFEQAPNQVDRMEFEVYRRQWNNRLGKLWNSNEIEEAVSEYFLFIARRDLWKRHLLKLMNSPVRSVVRSILELWQNPFVLFGKVKSESDGFLEIEEILGKQTLYLKKDEGMPVDKDTVVLGVVLPDNREHPNGIFVLSSLMFVKDVGGFFERDVVKLAETSGFEKSYDFYKEHMVEMYAILLAKDSRSIDELIQKDFTSSQQEAVSILLDKLKQRNVHSEQFELLKQIIVTYLLREQPNFRKPEVISAGVFLVAIEFGLLDEDNLTNGEIAKMFDVSTNSMTKHAENIGEFVMQMFEKMQEEPHGEIAKSVGTDPLMTERMNWEMSVKMSRVTLDTFEEAQAYMNATMYEEFQPQGHKEHAQSLMYDAYDAENEQDRYRLAERAATFNPNNVDVLLLMAENEEIDSEKKRLYASAIMLGKLEFEIDEDQNPWRLVTNRPYMRAIFAYGVWLYENENFAAAVSQFEQLLEINPEDNQGARYLAIAASIHADDFERASEILDDYEDVSEDDAIYLFLDWYNEVKSSEGESEDADWMFELAQKENPYMDAIIEEDYPKLSYPKRSDFVAHSVEEAMFIWTLLK